MTRIKRQSMTSQYKGWTEEELLTNLIGSKKFDIEHHKTHIGRSKRELHRAKVRLIDLTGGY